MHRGELLAKNPLFRDLTKEEIAAIDAISEPHEVVGGDTLFHAGAKADMLYVVLLGTLEMKAPGHEHRLARFGTGQIVGVGAFVEGGEYPSNVTAVEVTRLLRIPCAALRKLFAAEPAIELKFYRNAARDFAHHVKQMAVELDRPYF